MPTRLLKGVNSLTYWFFGAKTASDKKLLKTIIEETNPKFLKWAINVIVTWKNRTQLKNVTHIHGTNDRILPLKTADLVFQKGGHLMIISIGKELGHMIREILRTEKQLP